ncbi:hypothetical protein CRENBAI_015408 [Crenichthys baileyi]|uniref:Secreted protein n=1 Tax=Crenichthys baileyi TaxID=28760 RepID=A0AAV9SHS4_9TELE
MGWVCWRWLDGWAGLAVCCSAGCCVPHRARVAWRGCSVWGRGGCVLSLDVGSPAFGSAERGWVRDGGCRPRVLAVGQASCWCGVGGSVVGTVLVGVCPVPPVGGGWVNLASPYTSEDRVSWVNLASA